MVIKEKEYTKSEKIQKFITLFILLSLIVALVIEFINNNWEFFFVTVLSIFLCLLPFLFQRRYRIYLPSEVQLTIVLFIYAGVFLGEVQNFFVKYWWWDSFLHVFSGFAMALIAFGIMYVLYKTEKIKTSIVFISVIIFSLSISIGVIWEIFEFGVDHYFETNMQRARNLCPETGFCDTRLGVVDTMKDFILNSIGALFASILGYIYLKKGEHFLLNRIVNKFRKENPRLFYK